MSFAAKGMSRRSDFLSRFLHRHLRASFGIAAGNAPSLFRGESERGGQEGEEDADLER